MMSREFWATVSVGIAVIAVTLTGFTILSARIDALENRLDARITAVETGLNARITAVAADSDAKIASLDRRVASLEASMDARFDAFEAEMDAKFAAFEDDVRADISAIDGRLVAIENRMHEMNTRLSRIEGHLGLPADPEPEDLP